MRPAVTARPSWFQTCAMQLGASVRGVVYGFALIIAVPLAWTDSQLLPALLIGGSALIGMGMEAAIYLPRDRDV
jgi:hypothetical protein